MTVITKTDGQSCEACGSLLVTRDGFVVCSGCGLVSSEVLVPSSFNRPNCTQHVFYADDLGSQISRRNHDANGREIPEHFRTKLTVLRQIQIRSHFQDRRSQDALRSLSRVCGVLALPEQVRRRAISIFLKAFIHWRYVHYAELAITAILTAIRQYHQPITFKEVKAASGRQLQRVLLRDARFQVNTICPVRWNRPEDFLPRVISGIRRSVEIQDRATNNTVDLNELLLCLEKTARLLLHNHDTSGRHPLEVAVSSVYAASRDMDSPKVLTQGNVARATGTNTWNVDYHWTTLWRPIVEAGK